MKRILGLTLVLVAVLLALASCGDNDPCKDGHSFTSYTSNGDATCTADGTKTAKCDRCDVTDTVDDVGSQKGHHFDPTTYLYDSVNHWFKCTRCDAVAGSEAHVMQSGDCTKCEYSIGGGSTDYNGVTVMNKGVTYNYVITDDIDKIPNEISTAMSIMTTLNSKGFKFWRTYMDEDITAQEIVVGYDANRDISRRAYDFLNRLPKDNYFEMRYVVYADNGNIAIAYELNRYTDMSVISFVIDELIEKLVGNRDYIAIDRGIVMQGSFDLIEEQEKLDDATEARQWETVKNNLVAKWGEEKGLEFLEAFKQLYSLYQDGLVVWAANLYDPGIGGFYATASGRDHEGIYPSPETTGMCLDMGGSFGAPGEIRDLIPDIMKYQIIYYLKSVQYSDGYFYPPGASRAVWQTTGVAARGRSLSRAESLFRSYGAKPQYDTANLYGDGKTADEYWAELRAKGLVNQDPPKVPKNVDDLNSAGTASLRTSSVVAVAAIYDSSVVATATTVNELNDYYKFIDWLETNNIKASPYGPGNTIQARLVEFHTASRQLENNEGKFIPKDTDSDKYKKYHGMNMLDMIYYYCESCINPATGIWGFPNDSNPTGTEFLYTNGFFKIIAIYESLGRPVPYPVKSAEALMQGTVSKEGTSNNACDVYNIWASISMLQTNIKKWTETTYLNFLGFRDDYGTEVIRTALDKYLDSLGITVDDPEYETKKAAARADIAETIKKFKEDTLKKIDDLLNEYGALPIITSYKKQKGYQKEDGSFSHSTSGSAETYQGPLVVGLGYKEGDIDAIAKALWSTIGPIVQLYGATGKSGYYLHNYMIYMQILLENGPVIKYSYKELEAGTAYVPNNRLPGPSYANAIPGSSSVETVTTVTTETLCVPSFNTSYSSSGKKQYYVA
ncbi:MAG: hypothetical protein J6Q85_00795 [Clostridia bacterium]|nr:hypothetical protein [Clostridia bacterium]